MAYSNKNLETSPKPTMTYKELMEAGRLFTASEYATYMGTSMPTAAKELTAMVLDGKAEIVSKQRNSTTYRLKPPLLNTSDPFNLVKRNEPPIEDINAWMWGAQIS